MSNIEYETVTLQKSPFKIVATREIWDDTKMHNFNYAIFKNEHLIGTGDYRANFDFVLKTQAKRIIKQFMFEHKKYHGQGIRG